MRNKVDWDIIIIVWAMSMLTLITIGLAVLLLWTKPIIHEFLGF